MNEVQTHKGHELSRRGDLFISTDVDLLDVTMIHDFLSNRSYWAAGRSLERVRKSIENSLCFGLYDSGKQIGFARIVSDLSTFAWLGDVFILEEYRGKGLAKWLIGEVMAHPEVRNVQRIQLGTKDAQTLYQRFGFVPHPTPERFMLLTRPQ